MTNYLKNKKVISMFFFFFSSVKLGYFSLISLTKRKLDGTETSNILNVFLFQNMLFLS